jgi:hypothetical protein
MESSIATRASNYDLPSTATANLIIHHVAKNAEALRAVQGKPLHLSWRARGIFDKTIIVFAVEYQQDHQDNLNVNYHTIYRPHCAIAEHMVWNARTYMEQPVWDLLFLSLRRRGQVHQTGGL